MNALMYLTGVLRPARFFETRELSLRTASIGMGLMLFACMVVLVLTAFLFGSETISAGAYTIRAGDTKIFRVSTPFERMFFPFFWIIYIAAAGLVRQGATAVYGVTARDLRAMYTVTIVGAAPLALAAALQALLNNLFPVVGAVLEAQPILIVLRTLIALGLYGTALYFEGRFCVFAFRRLLGQPIGLAILTWLALPHISLLVLAFIITAGWAGR